MKSESLDATMNSSKRTAPLMASRASTTIRMSAAFLVFGARTGQSTTSNPARVNGPRHSLIGTRRSGSVGASGSGIRPAGLR